MVSKDPSLNSVKSIMLHSKQTYKTAAEWRVVKRAMNEILGTDILGIETELRKVMEVSVQMWSLQSYQA